MAPVNPHEDIWKHLLERKGLSSVASVLEEYGLSCEADVSRLDETDLGALSSKLKQLQNNLLRKWVRGLYHTHTHTQAFVTRIGSIICRFLQ